MKITTRNRQTFIVPKLIWPDIQGSIHLATDGDGKWFGPTEIVEIVDSPLPDSDSERALAVLRVENDALKSKLASLESLNETLRNRNVTLMEERDGLQNDARTATDAKEKAEKEILRLHEVLADEHRRIANLQTINNELREARERSQCNTFTQRFEITIKPV